MAEPTSGSAVSSASKILTPEFLTLSVSASLFFGAMGALNPVLPKFISEELGGSTVVVGVAVGSFALISLCVRPTLGRLGDRHGARLLLVIGCLAGVVGMLALLLARSPAAAIAARLPHGFAQAAMMTGSTTLAMDLAPAHRRGEAASYILVAFHLGLALGPLLGETARARWGYDVVWVAAAVSMAAGAASAGFLPHRRRDRSGPPSGLLHPAGVVPGAIMGLGMMGFVAVSSFVALYAKEIGVERVAPVFLLNSMVIALVRITAGRLPDRLGPVRSTSVACGLAASGSLIVAIWHAPAGLYSGVALLSAGAALMTPSLVPVAVQNVPEHRRASALATFSMFMDVSVAITGPLFGLIASQVDYRGVFIAGATAAAGALVLVRTMLARKVASWGEPTTT